MVGKDTHQNKMMINMKNVSYVNFYLFLFIFFSGEGVFALTPPTSDQTLCYLEGEVLSHQKEEATDFAMNRIEVDTITLRTHTAVAIEETYEGDFCESMAGNASLNDQKVNTFRLCDETNAAEGEVIKGIVGKSLGGGRYCIEGIKLLIIE